MLNTKKKLMNYKIALFFFFITNSILFAQNKFENGTIFYKNGNEENGLIEFHNKNNKEVLFKKDENDTPKKLTPNQIAYYFFKNLNKKIVSENINSYKYAEQSSNNISGQKIISEEIISTPHFLEVLVEGKSNLLFLDVDNSKKRYFLKSEKSGLKELDIVIRDSNSIQNKQFKLKRYIGILGLEFNDCETVQSKVNTVRFSQSDLSKIFIEYNNCVDNVTFESERINRKNLHNLIVEAGLYSSQIKSKGTSVRGNDFKNSITPGIGVHYMYTPTSFSSRVSLSAGASYNTITTEADYFRNFQVLIGDFRTAKIDLKTINLRLGAIYNFNKSKKKINPNLGVYYINSRIINSDPFEGYSRIDKDGDTTPLYSDFGVEMQRSVSGFAIEFGVNYQIMEKNDIIIRLGYEKIGDFLFYQGASYPSNTFALKLGYNFNL